MTGRSRTGLTEPRAHVRDLSQERPAANSQNSEVPETVNPELEDIDMEFEPVMEEREPGAGEHDPRLEREATRVMRQTEAAESRKRKCEETPSVSRTKKRSKKVSKYGEKLGTSSSRMGRSVMSAIEWGVGLLPGWSIRRLAARSRSASQA